MEPGNSMQNLYKNTEELKVKKQKHNIFKEKKMVRGQISMLALKKSFIGWSDNFVEESKNL